MHRAYCYQAILYFFIQLLFNFGVVLYIFKITRGMYSIYVVRFEKRSFGKFVFLNTLRNVFCEEAPWRIICLRITVTILHLFYYFLFLRISSSHLVKIQKMHYRVKSFLYCYWQFDVDCYLISLQWFDICVRWNKEEFLQLFIKTKVNPYH